MLHEQDLRGHPAPVESEAQRLSEAHAQLRFDLQRDLPVRVLLLRLGEEEYLLHVVMHHIASDGWSTGVLLKEFELRSTAPTCRGQPIRCRRFRSSTPTTPPGNAAGWRPESWRSRASSGETT